jgi:hypothetical protein
MLSLFRIGIFVSCTILLTSTAARSQNVIRDTLKIDLFHAEKMFLDSNLQLLAQRYNIDANEALILQAKLWPNPNFSIGHTLYSAQLHQFFPTGYNDETTLELDQGILTAYAAAQAKGYISEKDLVRIKAQLYSFVSEYNDLINQINDTESELRLMPQARPTVYIDPVPYSTNPIYKTNS